jgi:hypothetical protein
MHLTTNSPPKHHVFSPHFRKTPSKNAYPTSGKKIVQKPSEEYFFIRSNVRGQDRSRPLTGEGKAELRVDWVFCVGCGGLAFLLGLLCFSGSGRVLAQFSGQRLRGEGLDNVADVNVLVASEIDTALDALTNL